MHARRILALLVPVAAMLAFAASAQAGIPFTVGAGTNPDVAVDASGTAHVVWHRDPSSVMYCQVPRGALACRGTPLQLTAPLSPVENSAHVFLAGGSNILVTTTRCCAFEIDLYSSTDNGATFSGPVKIGEPPSDWADVGQVQGPGASLSAFSLNSYMNLPLGGPPPNEQASFSYGPLVGISATGALFNGTTPVHVFSDGQAMQFTRWAGTDPLNHSGAWTTPAGVGQGDVPSAAGGSAGLVVLSRSGSVGAQRYSARKFNGTTFGAPVGVTETGSPDLLTLRAAPTNGRFTAVWICNACAGGRELRVSQSTDGTTWTAPLTILKSPNTDNVSSFRPRAAVAGDGEGFAVWDTGTDVRATSLDPPGGPAPATNQTSTTTVGDQSVGFDSPKGCVHPLHPIVLNVVTKTKQNLVGKQPKTFVQQVVFAVDKKKVTDKKKKFTATFKTTGFVSGSTHSGSAVITFKQQGRKKTFTKTVKKSFKIC